MKIGDRLEIQPYEYGWKVSKIVDNDPTNKSTKWPTRKVIVGYYPRLDYAVQAAMEEWLKAKSPEMSTALDLLLELKKLRQKITNDLQAPQPGK